MAKIIDEIIAVKFLVKISALKLPEGKIHLTKPTINAKIAIGKVPFSNFSAIGRIPFHISIINPLISFFDSVMTKSDGIKIEATYTVDSIMSMSIGINRILLIISSNLFKKS